MLFLDYLAGVNVNCSGLRRLGRESEAAAKQESGLGAGRCRAGTEHLLLHPSLPDLGFPAP